MSREAPTEKVLLAIGAILNLCNASQAESDDVAGAKEIDNIAALREDVIGEWPLSWNQKRYIYIGPYAAKNLYDWNYRLGRLISSLDDVLHGDGKGVDELLQELGDASSDNEAKSETGVSASESGRERTTFIKAAVTLSPLN